MKLTSSAFSHQSDIPTQYTCEGKDLSPPLSWTDLPAGTKSVALIIDDPDAPDPKAPKLTWVHWVLYNLPPKGTLAEGTKSLPDGTLSGFNDFKKMEYGGPCPPIGKHRYFHKLYALDSVLPDLKNPTKQKLLEAMSGHILAQTELIGLYQKKNAN